MFIRNTVNILQLEPARGYTLPLPVLPRLRLQCAMCKERISSTSCIGLSSVVAPQIWLILLFLGRPRLPFPIGLYVSIYRDGPFVCMVKPIVYVFTCSVIETRYLSSSCYSKLPFGTVSSLARNTGHGMLVTKTKAVPLHATNALGGRGV
jgi:hypothetical protein